MCKKIRWKKCVETVLLQDSCSPKITHKNHMCVFSNGFVILQNDAFGQKQMTTKYEKITSGTFCDTHRADWKC